MIKINAKNDFEQNVIAVIMASKRKRPLLIQYEVG
jgi:hypothetical protein